MVLSLPGETPYGGFSRKTEKSYYGSLISHVDEAHYDFKDCNRIEKLKIIHVLNPSTHVDIKTVVSFIKQPFY